MTMNTKTRIAQLITLAAATSVAQAETFTVGPSFDFDFITITAAIAASSNGDVIEIQPGLYPENLDIINFDLTLRNAGGGTVTVFGQGLDKCLRVNGPEADVVIEGITFSNGASASAGGGVSIEGSASAIITDCIIENSSSSTGGGGFYVSGAVVMSDTIIRNNTTTGDGGGIYIFNSASQRTFTNVTIEGNTGVNGGGMAYVTSTDTSDFIKCNFIGNHSTSRGGAIAVVGNASAGIVDADECVFDSNTSDGTSGAVWVSDLDTFRATNSLFIHNSAATRGGVTRTEQNFEAVNCTFVSNTAGSEGINDTFETNRTDADIRLLNCIVVNDSAGSHTGSGELIATYSLIPEASTGPADANGNFNADPMFVDALMGDYRLMAVSPAIDAGNSRGMLGDTDVLDIDTDLNGNVRNLDDTDTSNTGVSTWELCVDLGAYEFQPVVEPDCIADITDDGILDFFDVSAFLSAFGDGCPE